jgi:hypothetical protein
MIENPRTGEQVEFEVRLPQMLVMQSTWTRRGQRASPGSALATVVSDTKAAGSGSRSNSRSLDTRL